MASIWQRILKGGEATENRAATPYIPARSASVATPDTALSLTAVFRCMEIIATPISSMEIQTFRYLNGTEERLQNPLLVNNPSLTENRRAFLYSTVTEMGLTGEAFWIKSFNQRGEVVNLTLVPSNGVSVRVDNVNTGRVIYGYMGKDYGQNEVEHLRLFTRAGNLRGLSPVQTCSLDIQAALDLRLYAQTWFTDAGVPTGILKTNSEISAADADTIRGRWHSAQKTRQIAVLGNGTEYQATALNPSEALFDKQQMQATQQIARLFGVPARLLLTGVDGTSDTYSNLQDEQQVFWRHTLMNYTDAIQDALSNCLPRGTFVRFDFEGLFRADVKSRYEYYKIGIDGGWLTPEYIAKKEGISA
jgi:HK97 family phage portal protein